MPSPSPITAEQRRGVLAASVCYFLWGLVPIFWKQLSDINAVELIAHRHIWSLVFAIGILAAQGDLAAIGAAISSRRALGINFLSGTMLTANWLVYVWGVNNGHVIESSLGYFLVPLVNVATGRFVLHEHLRPLQWTAIVLACLGVAILMFQLGRPPWIALGEAAAWGVYSLMRKQSPLPPVVGLAVDTLLLAPLAIGFLLWQHHRGVGALGRVPLGEQGLVLCTGIVTSVPLLLFAFSAQRIRLSTLGLLQYIAPTVQFSLALVLYHEPFTADRLISFGLIWLGLALYTFDNLVAQRR